MSAMFFKWPKLPIRLQRTFVMVDGVWFCVRVCVYEILLLNELGTCNVPVPVPVPVPVCTWTTCNLANLRWPDGRILPPTFTCHWADIVRFINLLVKFVWPMSWRYGRGHRCVGWASTATETSKQPLTETEGHATMLPSENLRPDSSAAVALYLFSMHWSVG